MAYKISRVQYFHTTVKDRPGEAYKFLSNLARLKINLLAFTAVPVGPAITQLTIFPESPALMKNEATRAGLFLEGPYSAIFVQGDDELGGLAEIHLKIYEADVNVYSASGVLDGKRGFGYIIYVKSEDFDKAAAALGI
jgi:hypothetical protein